METKTRSQPKSYSRPPWGESMEKTQEKDCISPKTPTGDFFSILFPVGIIIILRNISTKYWCIPLLSPDLLWLQMTWKTNSAHHSVGKVSESLCRDTCKLLGFFHAKCLSQGGEFPTVGSQKQQKHGSWQREAWRASAGQAHPIWARGCQKWQQPIYLLASHRRCKKGHEEVSSHPSPQTVSLRLCRPVSKGKKFLSSLLQKYGK